jgi:hypothetical protein
MKKAYKYRLYPTKKQERLLHEQLVFCTELYNAALQERKDAYTMCGLSITFTQQCAQLPAIKEIRPEYEAIYSQVLQDVLHRVDKAFKAFFRRVKAGQSLVTRAINPASATRASPTPKRVSASMNRASSPLPSLGISRWFSTGPSQASSKRAAS